MIIYVHFIPSFLFAESANVILFFFPAGAYNAIKFFVYFLFPLTPILNE